MEEGGDNLGYEKRADYVYVDVSQDAARLNVGDIFVWKFLGYAWYYPVEQLQFGGKQSMSYLHC